MGNRYLVSGFYHKAQNKGETHPFHLYSRSHAAGCRQRPSVQLYIHQAPRKAHSQLGCSVGLQCKRVADSSNLFIPVMEH